VSAAAERARTTRWAAVAAAGSTTAISVASLVLLARTPRDEIPFGSRPEETLPYFAMQLAFAIVGAVVLWRRPRNSIGWAFTAVAFASSVEFAGTGYGLYALHGPAGLPLGDVALWVYSWAGIAIVPMASWIVLAFPDGWLSTRRSAVAMALITVGAFVDFLHSGGAVHRGAHAVLVVFTDPQHAQSPGLGEVQRFMEIADVGRAVAEHTDGDVIVLGILVAERETCGDGEVSAYDGMSAPHVFGCIRHVHRTALALRHACCLAK